MKTSKGKIFFYVLSLLLLIAFGIFFVFKENKNYKNYKKGDSLSLKLKYNLKIINNDKTNDADITLIIPQIPTIIPFQKAKLIYCGRKPVKTYIEKDNIMLSYKFKIPKKGEQKLTFEYLIDTYDVDFEVNPDDVVIDDFKKFTGFEPYIESTNSKITEKAKIINESEYNPYYQALNIYDYIIKKYKFDLTLKPKSALEALNSAVLQCSDSTLLYAALVRSLKIPVRIFGGIYYWNQNNKNHKETHAWCEVYAGKKNGWITADPTLGRFDEFSRWQNFAHNTNKHIYLWRDMLQPYIVCFNNKIDPSMIYTDLNFEIEKITSKKSKLPKKEIFDIKKSNYNDKTLTETSKQLFNKALGFLESEDYAASLARFNNLISQCPDFLPAYEGQILSYYYLEKIKECVNNYYSSVSEKINDNKFLFLIGTALIYDSKYSLAESYLNKALKSGFPDKSYVFSSLGTLCERTKQINKALKYYKKSLELNPGNLFARVNLFRLYFNQHDWGSIVKAAEKDEKYYKNQHFLPLFIGCAYLNCKIYDKAVDYLEISCKNTPDLGAPHILLGIAYKEQKKYEKAVQEMEKGIKLKKGIGDVEFFKKILKQLKQAGIKE